jgi:hypothetical protein
MWYQEMNKMEKEKRIRLTQEEVQTIKQALYYLNAINQKRGCGTETALNLYRRFKGLDKGTYRKRRERPRNLQQAIDQSVVPLDGELTDEEQEGLNKLLNSLNKAVEDLGYKTKVTTIGTTTQKKRESQQAK